MLQSPIRIPLIKGGKTYKDVTDDILRPMANKPGKTWYLGIFLSGSALLFGAFMIFWTNLTVVRLRVLNLPIAELWFCLRKSLNGCLTRPVTVR